MNSTDDPAEGTRVDLGEDLLEKSTRSVSILSRRPPGEAPPSNDPEALVKDMLHSARILLNEGIIEEAKKTLRKVLLAEASGTSHAIARQMLDEIHELELKQIFTDESDRKQLLRNRYGGAPEPSLTAADSESVVEKLDFDLDLDIEAEFSLFGDPKSARKFQARLEKDFARASLRDRIDVAVAFIEMGLHEFAISVLKPIGKVSSLHDLEEVEQSGYIEALSAVCLMLHSLIEAGRPYEAISMAQPALRDVEIPADDKLEVFYLLGRANEDLGKLQLAQEWYGQVHQKDPKYRDVEERLRRCARPR